MEALRVRRLGQARAAALLPQPALPLSRRVAGAADYLDARPVWIDAGAWTRKPVQTVDSKIERTRWRAK